MAGAYVAKPADPAVSTKPPGWGDWPYNAGEAPFPPGYRPIYTMIVTGPPTMAPYEVVDIQIIVYDQDSFPVGDPSPSELRSTSTVGAESVNLKIGDVGFLYSINSEFESVEDSWGLDDTHQFAIDGNAIGQTLVYTAQSEIREYNVVGYLNIEIVGPEFALSINASSPITIDDPTSSVDATLTIGGALTAEPVGYTIIWTAAIGGREVMTPTTVNYSLVGGFWGHEGDLEFDLLAEDDAGETITLTATSTVWDDIEVSDTASIRVGPFVVSYSASAVAGTFTPVPNAYLGAAPIVAINVYRGPIPFLRDTAQMGDFIITWNNPDPDPIDWDYYPAVRDNISENICTASDSTITASCAACVSEKTYRIAFYANPGGTNYDRVDGSVTFSATAVLSDGSEITHSVVKSVVDQGTSVGVQMLIDVDAGTATWEE